MLRVAIHVVRRYLTVSLPILATSACLLIARPAAAFMGGDTLDEQRSYIESDDSAFSLRLRNGTVAMYRRTGEYGLEEIWEMLPGDRGTATRFVAQTDGDLVIVDDSGPEPVRLWHSDTANYDCRPGDGRSGCALRVESDGRLVYAEGNGRIIWSSADAGPWHSLPDRSSTGIARDRGSNLDVGEKMRPGEYLHSWRSGAELHMLADGDVVMYDSSGAWLWDMNTGSAGWNDTWLTLQDDGNLVVYQTLPGDTREYPRWNSQTWGHSMGGAGALSLRGDGVLVLWEYLGSDYWSADNEGKWRKFPNGISAGLRRSR